jgi:rRNA maturation endonuclease Nob1
MMTDQEMMNMYGWQDVCQEQCYTPYPHTHKFDRDKYPSNLCSDCGAELHLDAQCKQSEFGKNNRILLNCYECSKCLNKSSLQIQLA